MIRIPVNLASEPFQARRAPLIGMIAACGLLGALLMVQGSIVLVRRGLAADERRQIARITRTLTAVDRDQASLDATLRQPENAEVLEHSLFLNELIERKAISWTKLFQDLEGVFPYNVRLIAVRLPQIDAENRVQLDMLVGAAEPRPVLDLLRKLEVSPRFGPASVPTVVPASQNEKLLHYRISVNYAQQL